MSDSSTTTVRWALPAHTAGAALLAVIGVAHLLMIHVFNGADTPAEETINELSRQATTPMFEGGREVTVFGLNTGYSVGMAVFAILFALLAMVAARAAPQLLGRWSPFNALCFAAAGATFWIACLYFPEPVIVFAGLATLCFAAVLVAGQHKGSGRTALGRIPEPAAGAH
ncbi:hypothetical protein IU433_17760 [Nocardia puris]|uniref:Uncharacterized protein n=1 Tax=Nocardia puris TaxID=208602 RepID=A0A366D7T6_9NOCA|nr:hypothetical protein [Nocardia puris]MBF6212290.1 hypothetical protein [Nocardia puris]MBF6366537.1 hypothetical protein [Nocardia puris]MBF6460879.1 hypothetical protein [Nocardia puris]RBO85524.1 hypothetical protein DFR74_11465 [Nocardia puris]